MTVTATTLPPGFTRPSWLQLLHYVYRPLGFLQEGARRYGDMFTVHLLGVEPIVVVSNPAAIQDIFSGDPEIMQAGKGNFVVEPLVGPASLLILDGPRHLQERRLMLPAFHTERMRTYGQLMQSVTDAEIASWPKDRPFVLHEAMQRITLDVILRAVFGVQDVARLDWWRARLQHLLSRVTSPLILMGAYLLRARGLNRLLSVGVDPIRAGRLKIDFSRFMPWTVTTRVAREVDAALYDEIRLRKKSPSDDILSLLIAARDDLGRRLLPSELRDEMMTLLIAGHETTATTLSFVVEDVLRRPEVLQKIRTELREVAGDGPVRAEHAPRLEYLDAVIKESMRLVPIIPIVARQLKTPYTVGGLNLPAGIILAPCPYLAHRHPQTWDEPETFRPERFIGRRVALHEYLPFGGGVRRCLGAGFASYEMKVVLARLFSRVSLHLGRPGPARVVRRAITLFPQGGVPVVVDSVT